MTYQMKFKSEANLHKVYSAFKAVKLSLKVDPARLLMQVSDVEWTLPQMKQLVKDSGGYNVKMALVPG